jgi:16S rRNA (cytosine967-C5)-methyltransferase
MVKTLTVNLDEPFDSKPIGVFDRILVDAPCSGMGVIRRNPDSKWNLSKKNLNRFNKRQVRFLSAVSSLLKPDGVLVYAVCSNEPEENEGVIESFLHGHPAFTVVQPTKNEKFLPFLTPKGFYMSLPHIHNMDGFFIACLKQRD